MIKLTQTVQKSGCAAKVPASELASILKRVSLPTPHSALIVDGRHFDDAAIYAIDDKLSLVQTLDFFTPIVDSPFIYGQIAAANAMSDVYAMGGLPKTAMVILGYPVDYLESEVIVEILNGVTSKVGEAGANVVGGHTIDDESLKVGLSVTGFVDTKFFWSNQGAQVGDDLILTKPIGTGTATAALKRQSVDEGHIQEEIESMKTLNSVTEVLIDLSKFVHSATDITGFGLAGHASNMAKASQLEFQIDISKVPRFQNTMQFLEKGFLTKAHRTNKEFVTYLTDFSKLSAIEVLTVCDPQTSGGLLLSIDPSQSDTILKRLKKKFPDSQIIGRVNNRTSEKLLVFK